ncbi:hypothetical protein [Mycobacterium sp.]|uniref:hypothetical protein n=1 Tax=Mycobacterium sp. TaxID=1785 RepID=UPI0039C9C79A
MAMFKTWKKAMAESKHALESELQRAMPLPPVADLAAEIMPAFGPGGPKPGKSLTLHQLVTWRLGQYEFSSSAKKAIAYPRLETPVREALQVLEHAELVYLTVAEESADNWTATRFGLEALRGGKDVVAQRIKERSGAAAAPVTPPQPSTAQRLQELESLLSTGVISESEYTAKREQIINEL